MKVTMNKLNWTFLSFKHIPISRYACRKCISVPNEKENHRNPKGTIASNKNLLTFTVEKVISDNNSYC